MLPNISADVIEKQKVLQPGNCVGFGGAFKLPMVIKMEMPNPAPNSNSCDVNNCWKIQDINKAIGQSSINNDQGGGSSEGESNSYQVIEEIDETSDSTGSEGGGLADRIVNQMPVNNGPVNPALVGLNPIGAGNQGQ